MSNDNKQNRKYLNKDKEVISWLEVLVGRSYCWNLSLFPNKYAAMNSMGSLGLLE